MKTVKIIGAGLAGCECALQLAAFGIAVKIFDIKPTKFTPAHTNPEFCELVCSNSLKSNDVNGNACGLLKEELRILDSFVLKIADKTKVSAGNALAVNREDFAKGVTELVKNSPNIEIINEEIEEIDLSDNVIIATGPLTTEKFANFIQGITGDNLFFFDAAAPIITRESIDFENAFIMDRYGKGEDASEGDYINCPMTKEEYQLFISQLISSEKIELKSFEGSKVFEGCMPIEVAASRGLDTLKFGALKPVGLIDPKTDRRPYAVLQLRKEDENGTMYNLVGFQTNLKFTEQKRVFSTIPALKNAEYLRYGVMHKNIFINSPKVLSSDFSLKKHPNIFFAGQISGVEGYVESVMGGLMCAINMYKFLENRQEDLLGTETVIGALCSYVSSENSAFQPMNANYGIIKPLDENIKDKSEKKREIAERSIRCVKNYKERLLKWMN